MPRCGHPTANGPCERRIRADRDADVCFMHDESRSAPVGAPEGNTNAVGNPGGGAPELNTNAMRHGASCALEKVEARLDDSARQWVDERATLIEQRAENDSAATRAKARELALLLLQEAYVHRWTAETDSMTLAPAHEVSGKIRTLEEELGLWA